MSLRLQVVQVDPKTWGARVTLTSPKADRWVYARTKKAALQKLHTQLGKESKKLLSQLYRVHACADMITIELMRLS